MKKSVLILILVIYLGSIVMVGFFGMKVVSYSQTIVPTSVSCINNEINEENRIKLTYKDGLTYQLKWRVEPSNASQNVEFTINATNATINNSGLLSISKKGIINVEIICAGYNTIKTNVRILVM